MQLLKIYSENLYSFLNLEIDLTKYAQGTTIILGKNLDMDSSNGAGKSNILKLIYFALWGKDHQSVPIPEIVHDQSDGSFLIYIDFSDGNDMYRIIRYDSYKGVAPIELPGGVKIRGKGTVLLINGEEPFQSQESGKSPVQDLINSKLAMSPDIFLNSVFTPQEREKPFLKAADGEKKEVLSEILDLNYYDEAAKLLEKDIDYKNDMVTSFEKKIELNNQKKSDLKKNIQDLEVKITQLTKEYSSKREELRTRIADLKADLLDLTTKIEQAVISDLDELKKQILNIRSKISASENNLKDKNKVIALKAKLQSDISSFNKNYEQVEQTIQELLQEEQNVQLEISKLKEIPFKDYSEEIIQKQSLLISKKTKELELKSLTEKINTKRQDLAKIDLSLERAIKDDKEITAEIAKISEENSCQTCLRAFKEGESSILGDLLAKKTKEGDSLKLKITEFQASKSKTNKEGHALVAQSKAVEADIQVLVPIEKELQELLVLDEKNKNLREKEKTLVQRSTTLKESVSKKRNDLVILTQNNEKNNTELEKVSPILDLMEKEEIKLNQFRSELEIVQKDLSIKELTNQSFSSLLETKKNKEDLLTGMTSRLKELEDNRKNYQELFNKYKEELVQCENIEQEFTAKIMEQKDELKYLLFWEKGFSKTGIRSFIIDDVIEFLNEKVKGNLEVLSNGTTSLMFESENKGKTTGVVTNKIITKFFINGRERRLKLHSGGEAERATIAVDLALSDLAESRSGTKFSIRFLDEPFSAFDTKPQLKSFALFNKAAEEKQGFFIISHNKEFQQYCDHAIYVVKQDGVSRLVDAVTFMNIGENNV